jgi:hypothetical protein
MQRKVGTLEDSSLSYGEVALAFIALVKAKASGLAFHLANALAVSITAVGAYWSVWPKLAFDVPESGLFVDEVLGVENGTGHGRISYGLNHTSCG